MQHTTICIVGRINVGKSTLFNRLTRTRSAIVENTPGVTRDRKKALFEHNGIQYLLIDTGGLDPEFDDAPAKAAQEQTRLAIAEAQLALFMIDARSGLLTGDYEIARILKTTGRPVILIANKVDDDKLGGSLHEFMQLGFGEPLPISAEHNIGIDMLLDAISEHGKPSPAEPLRTKPETAIAVVGRSNVGKSSLINALLGEERHIVTDAPGTTRDSIDSVYRYEGRNYRLIDTAGIRRLGKTKNKIDKVASIIALKSIDRCDVSVLVIDAREGITAQDARVGGYIVEAGKGCIVAANKWDLTPRNDAYHSKIINDTERKFAFMIWAPVITMSAKTKYRIFKIFPAVDQIVDTMQKSIATSDLNRLFQKMQQHHPPPRQKNRRAVKFYYATQIETAPPTFLVFTNTSGNIHFSYKRYLINNLRSEFGFKGCPIRLVFKHKRQT
ncbi:ribosome biogenesis GTPase Der [bacterium]|nr:ribosome biogenesis GTPase Der [candidate division CSSED10-310 bacterium]